MDKAKDNVQEILYPAFETCNVTIATSSSDLYVPYLSVLLQSIYDNASENNNYDIIILNKDITDEHKDLILKHNSHKNISLRFVDVNLYLKGKTFHTQGLAIETYFRFFLIDVLKNYSKVIYLDCDMIVTVDIANLFFRDISDKYLAAAKDANLIACYHINSKWTPYLDNNLRLKEPYNYFQAGLLLINLEMFRKDFPLETCIDICESYPWRLFDQDVLNMLCQEHVDILDMRWNVMTGLEGRLKHVEVNAPAELYREYLSARKEPYVIHFCGKIKPWDYVEIEYADLFWKYARNSNFYEILLSRKFYNTNFKVTENKLISLKSKMEALQEVVANGKKPIQIHARISATKGIVGETIVLKCENVCGGIGGITYQFGVKTPNNDKFVVLQQYSNKTKIEYDVMDKGEYSFSIKAKDEYGSECVKILHCHVENPQVKGTNQYQERKQSAILFRCVTVFQLMNAINIKMNMLKNRKADLILSKATDFSEFIPRLKQLKIFRKIYISNDTPETYFKWKTLNQKEQLNILLNPEEFVDLSTIRMDYSDYYIGVVDEYSKLYYYSMIKRGIKPRIHIFEDGLSSYLINYIDEANKDIWKHEIYEKNSFINNIQELLLYEPELYMVSPCRISIRKIPKIDCNNSANTNLYNRIFGLNILPTQKFIFLEEAFVWDGISSTDMDLVEYIASLVGKDNIIIKLHPRNGIDRFSPRNFNLVSDSKIPWEMTIMNTDLSDKVLVTVSSTSAFTAGLVFGKPFKTINLFDIMLLGKNVHVRNPKFKEFYKKLMDIMNKDELQIFNPQTIDDLKETLIYLQGGTLDE